MEDESFPPQEKADSGYYSSGPTTARRCLVLAAQRGSLFSVVVIFVEIEDVNVGEDGHGSLQTGSTKTLKPGNVWSGQIPWQGVPGGHYMDLGRWNLICCGDLRILAMPGPCNICQWMESRNREEPGQERSHMDCSYQIQRVRASQGFWSLGDSIKSPRCWT